MPAEPVAQQPQTSAEAAADLLSEAELDVIEDELARAERTLALLADDDIDPASATDWL